MAKIEAGQIFNPDCFPPANELVCIEVPKVFDQVAVRDCITKTVMLRKSSEGCHPAFSFEGATDFDIVEVKLISKTDSMSKRGFKRLKLFVKIKYTINYSDGTKQMSQDDEASFNITINEIYCPNCATQIGVMRSPESFWDAPRGTIDPDGLLIKVEAIAEAFNDVINTTTGQLTIDIGAFFIVKCECVVQLLIPSYGYCPVPPEQVNPATQTCATFNDKTRTPFPTKFFPDQKWNPLDKND